MRFILFQTTHKQLYYCKNNEKVGFKGLNVALEDLRLFLGEACRFFGSKVSSVSFFFSPSLFHSHPRRMECKTKNDIHNN